MMRYELALGRALAGGRRIARAGVGQRAVGAVSTCVAGGPAEQNQSVAEIRPLFGRKTGGDFLLDFHGIGVCGPPIRPPTQSSGYAHHMRIDRESGDIERVAEHDVRGFAADPGKLVSSSIVRGTTPPNRSSSAVASPMRCWVFER